MPTHIFRGLISGSLLALTAASAVAGYPTAPEIADRYAAQSIAVRLTDAFVAPKSSTGWGATTAQVARINFLRPEPVAGLAASRLFINDMNGRLSIVDRATGSFSTYLDFDAIFNGVGSGDFDADPGYAAGLVTMEFDPAYATNGKFYTVHTELGPGSAIDYRQAVLSEWEDTNIADGTFTGTRAELLRVDYVNRIHPLGDISFNPAATDPSHPDWRNMYIASGDGGSGESRGGARDNPQRLDSLVGKILRILPTEAGTGGGYAIPADNPFAATTGANPAVFATGLRNPHRLSWDIDEAGTARGLISDIGLYAYEEVNLLTAGVNYGYSRIEGDQVLGADNRVSDDPLPTTLPLLGAGGTTLGTSEPTYPLAFYSHLDGDAIAGEFVYRCRAIPALQGPGSSTPIWPRCWRPTTAIPRLPPRSANSTSTTTTRPPQPASNPAEGSTSSATVGICEMRPRLDQWPSTGSPTAIACRAKRARRAEPILMAWPTAAAVPTSASP